MDEMPMPEVAIDYSDTDAYRLIASEKEANYQLKKFNTPTSARFVCDCDEQEEEVVQPEHPHTLVVALGSLSVFLLLLSAYLIIKRR